MKARSVKKPPPKKPTLAPALAKRAKAMHAAAVKRLAAHGREAIDLVRERRQRIAEDYFDIGQALVTLKTDAMAAALGYDDVATLLREELDLSVTTADKLIELATRVDRSTLRELTRERAVAVLALVDATPEDDAIEDLLDRPFALSDGGRIDLRTAPVDAIQDAARELRQKRRPEGKRSEGFTTTAEDRAALASLLEPVTRAKELRGVATFKLIASRKPHGPVVESRIPLRDYTAVLRLILKRR